MARSVTISLPSDRAAVLIEELAGFEGTLTLSRQQQASVRPPGDVVTVEVLERSTSALFALLSKHGAGSEDTVSVTASEPAALVRRTVPRLGDLVGRALGHGCLPRVIPGAVLASLVLNFAGLERFSRLFFLIGLGWLGVLVVGGRDDGWVSAGTTRGPSSP